MRQFLRRKPEQQVGMLTALTDRLERDLAKLPDGQLPGKEWVRVARLRLDAYRMLATLELETAKVRLRAERSHVRAPMTDEEFQAQLQALGRDAIGSLSVEELEAELERRRALPAPDVADDHRAPRAPRPRQRRRAGRGPEVAAAIAGELVTRCGSSSSAARRRRRAQGRDQRRARRAPGLRSGTLSERNLRPAGTRPCTGGRWHRPA